MIDMKRTSRILITGGSGMVGKALVNYFHKNKYTQIFYPSRKELDLMNKKRVLTYLNKYKPEYVFAAAAFVGGIEANMNDPLNFFYKNIEIQNNLINSCDANNVNNLLFFGSSCIYPKLAKQPIKEDDLFSGYLEKTNEAYAIAKIAGLKYCEYLRRKKNRNYFTIMPTNLYGVNDNYNQNSSHVIPALISKIHKVKKNKKKSLCLFGTGKAIREFLFVDDLAKASVIAMKRNTKYSMINVGSGVEITIKNLANLILKIANCKANIIFDKNMPDGTPRKVLDSSRIFNLGWTPKISLDRGLKYVYDMYDNNIDIRS